MIPPPSTLGLAGVAGLALGSFAVTAGVRMSRGESPLAGRSRCDACGCTLGFAQTLPVLSYVGLGGACAGCRARIDPTHLAGEVAGAAVLATSLLSADPLRSALLAGLGLTLIAAAAVDVKVRRLPDLLTAPVAALGLALSALAGVATMAEGAIAAVVAVALLLALRWTGERVRGEPGLGLGDVKLIGALALWLGAATPWLVVVAAVAGLALMALTRPADGRLAFGLPIALAAWLVGMAREAGAWPTMM